MEIHTVNHELKYWVILAYPTIAALTLSRVCNIFSKGLDGTGGIGPLIFFIYMLVKFLKSWQYEE